jgi:CDP-diacylglycerol--serine O-phosphatidyltransferase
MSRITLKRKNRRRRSTRLRSRRRPINVLASALTCAGLYCGMASILSAIDQKYNTAAYFILAALIFDMLDGTVAKLTKTTSEFGKQLDSLADLVSFGAAPALLIYTAYLREEYASGSALRIYGSLVAIIYVICGALRLARFNVFQAEVRDYFTGLPIPGAAMTVASFVLFTDYYGWNVAFWVLTPLTLGLAYLMVSNVRYPKDRMKSMVLAPKSAFRWLFGFAFIIAVVHYAIQESPSLVLFPVAAFYVLFGVGDETYAWVRRRSAQSNAPGEESESAGEGVTEGG